MPISKHSPSCPYRSRLRERTRGLGILCTGNKKEVEIEIVKHKSMDVMMLILAHELVHAKQFLKGELSPTMKN